MNCPCGSEKTYAACCEPLISGERLPETPEALMRSRYTAYVKAVIPYLRDTLAPESRADFNEKEVRTWAKQSLWYGLTIVKASGNTVEFIAKYSTQGKTVEHQEVAEFRKHEGRWYFVDGKSDLREVEAEERPPQAPVVRTEPKLGRNDPCACGSGKKYKKCCALAL